MKSKFCLFIAALCLLLCACATAEDNEPVVPPSAPEVEIQDSPPMQTEELELSQRAQDWAEDLVYLRQEYKSCHPDPFYFCPEEELDWKLDRLAAKVDELTDTEIYFELSSIMAGMNDLHTWIQMPDYVSSTVFPVTVRYFGERLYLCAYQEEYEQLAPYLLREIVAVNHVDISYLREKLGSYLSPVNRWYWKEQFHLLPSALDWADCGYTEGYTFQILNENREVESVEVPVVPRTKIAPEAWVYPDNWDSTRYKWRSPFMLTSAHWAEYFDGEQGGYIYLSFAELVDRSIVAPLNSIRKAVELIEDHPACGTLVIDLRSNLGGDAALLDYLREDVRKLNAPTIEHTYVITGGGTASAGIDTLLMFREEVDGVVTVGEPTGQFTFSFAYSWAEPVVLPHSQLTVYIPNIAVAASGDGIEEVHDENGRLYVWENTILPDVYIPQDIDDVRQGRDSVIEWIMKQ